MKPENSVQSLLQRCEPYLLPALIIITVAVFSPVAWHDFIPFDDNQFVYENSNIQAGLTLDTIRWAFTTPYEVNWIPLTWISHALDIQLFGLNPAGHHVVNLMFHAASTAVLFLFLRRATGAAWQSAAVATLFALHPLHVESVAWVAERKDVLSAFFGMLTCYAYTRYSQKPDVLRYVLVLLLFLTGLLCKPMLVTLPFVLLLLDWWPLNRLVFQEGTDNAVIRSRLFRLIAEKIPFIALSVCSSVITYLAQQAEGQLFQGYTLSSRLGKACIYYLTYIYKMVWPVDLAVLYPFPKYPPATFIMVLSALVLVTVSAVVVWRAKRFPYLITGWLWYLVTLLPVIGIIQIGQHTVADRYTYIPLIGIFMMMAWGMPQLLRTWRSGERILGFVVAAGLVAMVILTSMQLKHWKNGFTIFSHTVEVTTDNWVALNNLGLIYQTNGNTDEAIRYYKESLRAKPSYVLANLNLGVTYMERGEFDQAIEYFNTVLQFGPINPAARVALVRVYLAKGDRMRAMEHYQVLKNAGFPYAEELLQKINQHFGQGSAGN